MKNNTKNITEIEKTGSEYNVDSKKYIVGLLALFFSIAFAWLLIPIITNFINPPMVNMAEIKKLFISSVMKDICPEPIERTMFVTGVILLPVLLLMFICLFNYILKDITDLSVIKQIYNVLFFIFLSMIVYLAWVSNKNNNFLYLYNGIGFKLDAFSQNGISIKSGTILFVAFISILMNLLILSPRENQILGKISKIILFLADSICWIIILSTALISVYGISMVSDMGTYSAHFEGVFHSVVQVFLGKEILFNFLSQYGLYPHILEPIFRIIGLSVFKFMLIMGLLMGISLVLLYKLLKELIDNKLIAYLSLLSIIWCVCMFGRVLWMYRWPPANIDPYSQIYPLRLLFPIFSIYFTYYYLKTSSKRIYYLSFVIYSISILWNFDTGFVIYLTWLIMLIYEGLCDRDIKKIIIHIVNWILIFLSTFSLFTLYMYLRYGHMPMYKEFLIYQKMYFITGFGMLPMPLIHPWNLIVIIYIIGMAISLINLLNGNKSLKVFMIFYLTIFGTGIFSYYQGRSHDFCLGPITYPAILMLTIFADELIEKIREHKIIINFIALNFITFFMIYYSITFIKNYKIIFATISERAQISFKGESTPVIRNAEFIKNNTKRGEELLLLSNLSAIYHLESQTTSPIKSEPRNVITISRERDVLNYLSSDLCKKVFLDVNFEESGEKTIWEFVQTNFKLSLISPDRNIGLFVK